MIGRPARSTAAATQLCNVSRHLADGTTAATVSRCDNGQSTREHAGKADWALHGVRLPIIRSSAVVAAAAPWSAV